MRTTLTDGSKRDLLKRVIDMEKRGWECVHPISEMINPHIRTNYVPNKRHNTAENGEGIRYYVVMERLSERDQEEKRTWEKFNCTGGSSDLTFKDIQRRNK